MIGRLEAPGAKLEPVMPGLENRRSPSWAPPCAADFLVRHHRDGCELVGHDGQHALLRCGARAAGAGCGCGARSRLRPGAVRATRTGVRDGTTALRRTIGLGAVTVISGSCVAADGAGRVLRHRAVGRSRIAIASLLHRSGTLVSSWIVIVRILIPSMCDGSISIFPRRSPRGAANPSGCINQSMSGDGRRAGLERAMQRARDGRTRRRWSGKKLDRLRQQQQRRCREQHIVAPAR